MAELARRLGRALLDLLAPPACAGCGGPPTAGEGILCEACRGELSALGEGICDRCGLPLPADWEAPDCWECEEGRTFRQLRAWGAFDGALRGLVLRMKYGPDRRLVAPLAALMAERLAGFERADWDAVVPVPTTRRRLRQRGFDQALLLARGVAHAADLPLVEALRRCRGSRPQASLTVEERLENARGAFVPSGALGAPRGLSVLVVDDVVTSTATVQECALVLGELGVGAVDVLAIARTLPRSPAARV